MFSKFSTRMQTTYHNFPRPFWILMVTSFVDKIGSALLFPLFALYVTDHFKVGMKEVGIIFFIFSVTGIIGNFVAGALTDRWGRKIMVLLGLIISAFSTLSLLFINDLILFYYMTFFVGLFSNFGGPAQQAMIADILPEEQRAEGFSMWRVISNVTMAIGPAAGGFIAGYSYTYIFIADIITSLITVGIILKWLPETKPAQKESENEEKESTLQTYSGYFKVFKDGAFVSFLLAMMLVGLVYGTMYSTLSVFLVTTHSEPAATYGYILSINAALVVFAQLAITKSVANRPPMLILVIACLFYMVGFGLYGFIATFPLFVFAMVLITIGEMLHIPVAQSQAISFAPENMRGRYMAIFGLTFMVPGAIGPYLTGILMDDYNPFWVWYAAGILSALSAAILWGLHVKRRKISP